MSTKDDHIARETFQVDLKGMVDVLSHHLYSSPTVFVRELLQNAVDAIEARRATKWTKAGRVRFEVDPPRRTIIVTDNGIGLTRAQIAEFVSRVGASSKRALPAEELDRFIGQFGIGLLSCFMVTNELLILTRAAEPKSPTLEWKAHADGSYTLREIDTKLAAGTRVIMTLRADGAEYAEFPRLAGLIRKYGEYLHEVITVEAIGEKDSMERIVCGSPLWSLKSDEDGEDEDDGHALDMAGWKLGFRPLDAIAINDAELGLEAVAYVLPEPASPSQRGAHRLYLKRMFVSDEDVKVAPRWASFVRCVINSTRLRPTASREAVCEDDIFHATQKCIGTALSAYLNDLARTNRNFLANILAIHDDTMRRLARDDEEFFRLVIDLLPFETSRGPLRFGEYRAEHTVVRVAPTVDQFRACAAIAAAQGITIFNGGYANHAELLERAVALDPRLSLELVDARALMEGLGNESADTAPRWATLIELAEETLRPFGCRPLLRGFEPTDVPAVFAEGIEQSLARSLDAAAEKSEGFWRAIVQTLGECIAEDTRGAFLCLNSRCDILHALTGVENPGVLQAVFRVLYVQALLLGRQPLTDVETRAFVASLSELIDSATRGEAS